jgi:hypothetical protein
MIDEDESFAVQGHAAALVNYGFIANTVLTTEDAVKAMTKLKAHPRDETGKEIIDLLRIMKLNQYFAFADDEAQGLASLRPVSTA